MGYVGAVTALEYMMGRNFGDLYGKKMSGSNQKYKVLVYVVFHSK